MVPDFVVQDGDPRGDGEGGPGYTIRDEINQRPYLRGTVGMALDWEDTGGSQFFITHSPQPHLDARYTVFGTRRWTGWSRGSHACRGIVIVPRADLGRGHASESVSGLDASRRRPAHSAAWHKQKGRVDTRPVRKAKKMGCSNEHPLKPSEELPLLRGLLLRALGSLLRHCFLLRISDSASDDRLAVTTGGLSHPPSYQM